MFIATTIHQNVFEAPPGAEYYYAPNGAGLNWIFRNYKQLAPNGAVRLA